MPQRPHARVAHILGLEPPAYTRSGGYGGSTKTPDTLSGTNRTLNSYALTIASKRKHEGWEVYDAKNSPTTNRHLCALRDVLEANGYAPTDETRVIQRHTGWRVEALPYRTWRKVVSSV